MAQRVAFVVVLLLAAAIAGANPAPAPTAPGPAATKGMKSVVLPSGLEYFELRRGSGVEAKHGMTVKVHYTGWLAENKKKFDSSVDRHTPIEFTLGLGKVIRGWEEGIAGMKVGGRRQLHIPAKLGYGEIGAGDIPPQADLIFDVALVDAQP